MNALDRTQKEFQRCWFCCTLRNYRCWPNLHRRSCFILLLELTGASGVGCVLYSAELARHVDSLFLAIPVSLIGTFILFIPFWFYHYTLTLFAFVLAIGIVVDDAIVVVEPFSTTWIMRTCRLKMLPAKYERYHRTVIAIALILAAVFVPVGFIPALWVNCISNLLL